jgi:hypothetical protein
MHDRGTRIRVGVASGDIIEGWLYGENLLGVFISLDEWGRDIRFIPQGERKSVAYDIESSKAEFATTVSHDDLGKKFYKQTELALQRVDYNRIYRLGRRSRRIEDRVRSYQQDDHSLYGRESESSWALALEMRSTYAELLDELLRSGLGDVLLEFGGPIREQASLDSLPIIDGVVSSAALDLVRELRESDSVQETNLGRDILRQVTPEVIVKAAQSEAGSGSLPTELQHTEAEHSVWAKRLKRMAAVGKMALGGGFTASNIGLGVVAGVFAALPTLGLGTVAAAVGIMTSSYTGLNAAVEGVKDIATTFEAQK